MKRLCILLLTVVLLCAGCSVAGENGAPNGMKSASGELVDYDLFVPEAWKTDESGGAVSAYKSADDPASVSVMTWGMEHADDTAADWWETYKSEFALVFSEFTVESEENILLDGEKAVKYVYTAALGDYHYRYTQIACVRNTSVYLVTFTELAETDHSEEFGTIADVFKWRG